MDNHRQISLLLLTKNKQINKLFPPVKLSENDRFSDDFRGNSN